jgi:hypothetical protein
MLNGEEDDYEITKSNKIVDLIESNQQIEEHLTEVIEKLDSNYAPKV